MSMNEGLEVARIGLFIPISEATFATWKEDSDAMIETIFGEEGTLDEILTKRLCRSFQQHEDEELVAWGEAIERRRRLTEQ